MKLRVKLSTSTEAADHPGSSTPPAASHGPAVCDDDSAPQNAPDDEAAPVALQQTPWSPAESKDLALGLPSAPKRLEESIASDDAEEALRESQKRNVWDEIELFLGANRAVSMMLACILVLIVWMGIRHLRGRDSADAKKTAAPHADLPAGVVFPEFDFSVPLPPRKAANMEYARALIEQRRQGKASPASTALAAPEQEDEALSQPEASDDNSRPPPSPHTRSPRTPPKKERSRREKPASRHRTAKDVAEEGQKTTWRRFNPIFYTPGSVASAQKDVRQSAKTLEIPMAARVPCHLEVGIRSTQRQDVLARVLADVAGVGDGPGLPQGSILKGSATHDGQRIYVRISEAIVGGESYRITGYAVSDGSPGIAAIVHESSTQERQRSAVGKALLNTARGAAALLAQGAGGDVVGNIAREVTHEAREDIEVSRETVLEVPAGTRFVIVITG